MTSCMRTPAQRQIGVLRDGDVKNANWLVIAISVRTPWSPCFNGGVANFKRQ
jgi:hypothetical protein